MGKASLIALLWEHDVYKLSSIVHLLKKQNSIHFNNVKKLKIVADYNENSQTCRTKWRDSCKLHFQKKTFLVDEKLLFRLFHMSVLKSIILSKSTESQVYFQLFLIGILIKTHANWTHLIKKNAFLNMLKSKDVEYQKVYTRQM